MRPPGVRVLLFAYYFPPMGGMGSLRALGFARHLPAAGVEATVVAPRTGTYGHDPSLLVPEGVRVVRTGSLEPGVLIRRLRRGGTTGGVVREMRVGRLGALKRLCQALLHVPDANVGWVAAAAAAGIREGASREYDCVMSTSPPVSAHLAGAWTASRLGLPFVADVRDFFEAQRLFGGARARVDRVLEDRALGRVAGLVSPYRGIIDDLRRHRAAPGIVVPNGYDEEDFSGPDPRIRDGPCRLVHVGTTYAGRAGWGPLLGAAADVVGQGIDLRLRFVGREDAGIPEAAGRCGIADRCEFVGFTTHAEAVREMRGASALLLFSWATEGRVGRGLVLGKTFEYLRSGRPVLAVGPTEGEGAALLRELGGAVVRGPEDRTGIRDALLDIARGRGPSPASPDRLAAFSRRRQAARLARWLGKLVGSRR